MGFPVLPLLLLGVGVLALRRRTRTAKKATKDELPPPVLIPVVYIPPQDREPPKRPSLQPGQPCDAPDGRGAWDELGECKTFWIDGVTDDAIRQLARQEWEARGRPGFSDLCLAVQDELGGELEAPDANPRMTEIVAAALQRYYGVGSLFPPTEAHGGHEESSPYWVHEAWARAHHVVWQELCGG